MVKHDIVIIGGGPAGMAAAVSAYDAGVKDVAIIDREEKLGGILKQCIHNGFGLHKMGVELTGPEYALRYAKMVRERDIKVYLNTMVTSLSPDRTVTAQNREGLLEIKAGAVVLAMGCRERSRGALNICGTRPAGIFSAGTAQKLVNIDGYMVGKKVVILGSGDIGLIMARRMTLEGAKVEAVCEIMPYSGGLVRNIVQCLEDYSIPLYLSTTVSEIHGKRRLEGVTIAKVDKNKKVIPGSEKYIECDTLLLSCGLIPENELTRGAGIEIDPVTNGAVVDQNRQTSAPGIFAAGNVLHVHDLVDFVSDESELAGKSAAEYIKSGLSGESPVRTVPEGDVRYVLPQKVADFENEVSLFLRVGRPLGKVRFTVSSGEKNLASFVRLRAQPSIMEKLTLKSGTLSGVKSDIKVSVEEI